MPSATPTSGVNPSNDGNVIRISVPQLTEERRRELVKQAQVQGRGRQGLDSQHPPQGDGGAGPDQEGRRGRRGRGRAPRRISTRPPDSYVTQIDELVKHKEGELLEVLMTFQQGSPVVDAEPPDERSNVARRSRPAGRHRCRRRSRRHGHRRLCCSRRLGGCRCWPSPSRSPPTRSIRRLREHGLCAADRSPAGGRTGDDLADLALRCGRSCWAPTAEPIVVVHGLAARSARVSDRAAGQLPARYRRHGAAGHLGADVRARSPR